VNLSDLLESLERASEERDDDDEGEEVNDLEDGLRAVLDAFRDGQDDDEGEDDDDEDAITIDVTADEDDEDDEDTRAWLRQYELAEMRVWRVALQKARQLEAAVAEASDEAAKSAAEEAMVEAAAQEREARSAMLERCFKHVDVSFDNPRIFEYIVFSLLTHCALNRCVAHLSTASKMPSPRPNFPPKTA